MFSTPTLQIHPQTTSIHSNTALSPQHLLLVGYISISVTKPTPLESLHISFLGHQRLELRQGQGPSSSLHAVSSRCADIHQTFSFPATLSAGIHKYPFELSVPGNLPPSVDSPLGSVAYRLTACAKRPAISTWMPQRSVCAEDVPISVTQTHNTANNALTFQTSVDSQWDISVYGSSGVLVPGVPARLRAFATPRSQPMGQQVELQGFAATLTEHIAHRIPSQTLEHTTRRRVAVSQKRSLEKEDLTPCYSNSIDPLGALSLELGSVQVDSASRLFSVTHTLQISLTIRITSGERVRDRRLSFAAPVSVLPSTVLEDTVLPHYNDIERDTMLMSST